MLRAAGASKKKKKKKEKGDELQALRQQAIYLSYQPNSEKPYYYKPEAPNPDLN